MNQRLKCGWLTSHSWDSSLLEARNRHKVWNYSWQSERFLSAQVEAASDKVRQSPAVLLEMCAPVCCAGRGPWQGTMADGLKVASETGLPPSPAISSGLLSDSYLSLVLLIFWSILRALLMLLNTFIFASLKLQIIYTPFNQ